MSAERPTHRLAAVHVVGKVVSLLLQVLQFALLARAFGIDRFGAFAAGSAIALVASSLADFGVPTTVVLDRAERSRHEIWTAGAAAVTFTSVAAAAGGAVVAAFTLSGDARVAGLILSGWVVVSRVRPMAQAVRLADYEVGRAVAADIAFRGFGVVGAVVVHQIADQSFSVAVALVAGSMIAGEVTGAIIAWPGRPGRPCVSTVRSVLRRSRALGLTAAASASHSRLDQVLLGRFRVAQGGPYAVAYRLVDAALAIVVAAGSMLLPVLGRASGATRASISRALTAAALMFGAAVGTVLFLTAPLMVAIVGGEEFESATPLVRILAVVLVIEVVNMPLSQLVIVEGGSSRLLRVSLVAVAVNLGLNLWLIPRHGATGAAGATLATELLGLATVGWMVVGYRQGALPSWRPWRDVTTLRHSPYELVGPEASRVDPSNSDNPSLVSR